MSFERDMSVSEVARACRVAPPMVHRWIDSGLLTGYRVPMSRYRRVRPDDLRAFQERHGLTVTVESECVTRETSS